MATIALGAVFYAIGSAAGTAAGYSAATIGLIATTAASAGALAGSYIDQTFVYPAIFGKQGSQDLYGPRLDDFQFTTASPGSPSRFCIGPQNRVPGVVIWMSPILENKHTQSVGGGGKGGGGGDVTSFTYSISVAVAICDGPIDSIAKVYADGSLIYDATAGTEPTKDLRYVSIRFYPGTDTQLPDTLIQSYQGIDTTPAFRGTAYMVLEEFELTDFGNRLPNFTFVPKAQLSANLSDAMTAILLRAGRPTQEFSTIWLQGEELKGYTITGLQSPLKSMEPLMLAYNIVAQEKSGVVEFRLRKDTAIITVPDRYCGAHEEGSDPIRPLIVTEKPTFDLPAEVNVQYYDPAFYLQKSSQREVSTLPVAPISTSIDVPLTMSGDQARTLARRMLWGTHAERADITVYLPPSQMHIVESDVIDINGRRVRVTNVQRGANFILEVNGVSEQAHTLSVTATVEPPIVPPETPPQTAVVVIFTPLDIPLLPDTFATFPGGGSGNSNRTLYHAACAESPFARWRGATVFIAGPAKVYDEYDMVVPEATIGTCENVLPATGPTNHWDLETTLDIVMYNGTLESRTEADVLAGANVLAVGDWNSGKYELIQFCDVEQLDNFKFRISRIVRGRRGTEDLMGAHLAGDKAVLVSNRTTIKKHDFDSDFTNSVRYFKAGGGTGITDPSVYEVGPVTRTARPLRPFSVSYIRCYRNFNNDLTFKWLRRSRLYFTLFDLAGGAPSPDGPESYFFEVLDSLGATVLRSVTVVNSAEYTYTISAQAIDGYTPGNDHFVVRVSQISDKFPNNDNKGIPATKDFLVPDEALPI